MSMREWPGEEGADFGGFEELVGDFDLQFKDDEEDEDSEKVSAAEKLAGIIVVMVDVPAYPGHDWREKPEKDGTGKPAGIAEGDEEDVGINKGDNCRRCKDKKAEPPLVL